jgi:DNA polymerase elongation subunit (family B)
MKCYFEVGNRLFLEELNLSILKLLRNEWNRVIALDIETHIPAPDMFLTNEPILSVSLARRVSGELTRGEGISVKTILLDDENEESEKELLTKLNKELSDIKPLGVVGYMIRQYDIPLLVIKKERYKRYNLSLWGIVDVTESAAAIDLYHILKYMGYKKLEEALSSQEFAHLPFKRTKHLVSADREKKHEEVHRLWKEDRKTLREYSEGEVHDLLLIAEHLAFGICSSKRPGRKRRN